MHLLDSRLSVVEEPATIQIEQLHEVGLKLWKRHIQCLHRDHAACFDEPRAFKPIAHCAV
ncbi:hypothetical protein [Paraburkholderia bannensis]|uniref:hypothetical protein n=1 Tax=Paraburkholderia bannensis TaxID=765414 RepID=UPI002AB62723|nr:hypothetical protein [Paraburkholderia bannensis]